MELKETIRWIERLIRDFEIGQAKVVPAQGHVWRHFLREEPAPSRLSATGDVIPMMTREECTDLLKLWGFHIHIAVCPRTGIRFVEGDRGLGLYL